MTVLQRFSAAVALASGTLALAACGSSDNDDMELAAAPQGTVTGTATATTLPQGTNYLEKRLTVDPAAQGFDTERQIVDLVARTYGRTAVFDTGSGLPVAINEEVVAGQMLPTNAPVRPVPERLEGRLPQITPGARWVAVGKHLVELGPNNEITWVIYHTLP